MALDDLIKPRRDLVAEVVGKMPDKDREFLISFERGEPKWDLLGVKGVSKLPAVRWRMQNLDTLSPEKRAALVANLRKVLAK